MYIVLSITFYILEDYVNMSPLSLLFSRLNKFLYPLLYVVFSNLIIFTGLFQTPMPKVVSLL